MRIFLIILVFACSQAQAMGGGPARQTERDLINRRVSHGLSVAASNDEAGPSTPSEPSTGLYALAHAFSKSREGLDELEEVAIALSRSSISAPPTAHSERESLNPSVRWRLTTLDLPEAGGQAADETTVLGKRKRSRSPEEEANMPDEMRTPKRIRRAPTPMPSADLRTKFFVIDQARENAKKEQARPAPARASAKPPVDAAQKEHANTASSQAPANPPPD